MSFNPLARLRFISILVILTALFFVTRLFYLGIVGGSDYAELADRQYQKPATGLYNRGSIFFSTKDGDVVSAAGLNYGFIVAINPEILPAATTTYNELNEILPLDRETFLASAAKKNDPYEEVANRVDQTVADKIRARGLKGVNVYEERWRYYPAGSLASHVIGFMGYEGDEYTGRYGLEEYYNDVLRRSGGKSFTNFFAEIFTGLSSGEKDKGEGDIVTFIEPQVENFLEKELQAAKDKWRADTAGGIVMDPQTGAIYAMASLPNFHPGEKQNDITFLSNSLVQSVYEMGSIVKPLTMAMGLDTGAITAQTTYNDKGYVILNKARIENFDGRGRGVVPMQEILSQSLNTGAVFIAQKVGKDNMRKYFQAYGLGSKTGIDLPSEGSGLIKNLNSTRDIEYATAAFGQGIAVSPIEITRALAVLGNGGKLVRPRVVKEIRYKTLLTEKTKPEIQGQVIKPETGDEITRMLVEVVDKTLAGGKVKMPNYSIAAKTGTAQIAKTGEKGYSEANYLHSFFGYFPAYDPKFITFLYIVNPKDVNYSSQTLTDPFINITKFLLNYYQVPPDR